MNKYGFWRVFFFGLVEGGLILIATYMGGTTLALPWFLLLVATACFFLNSGVRWLWYVFVTAALAVLTLYWVITISPAFLLLGVFVASALYWMRKA